MTTGEGSGSTPFDPTVINENQSCLPERYEILKILGSGGMGRVLHARDRVLDREVAVKFLVDRYASDAVFAQRFLGEARTAASLNHPNIVQIYEFGRTDTCAYLVMEYVDGRTLRALMAELGRFSERRAVELIDTAAAALGIAHARGIVHRDVKPDNMMLTQAGEFKLVDLGLAKCLDSDGSHTETGQSMGTPHYISPEQVLGAKIIDQRADIYSLGASLFCLATGRVPFEGSSGAHIMSRHLNDPLPDPRTLVPELSEGFCSLVRRAMAKDPGQRYQDTDELRGALAAVRATAPAAPDHLAGTIGVEVQPSTTSASAATGSFATADLQAIEGHLTRAIGPVARLLVDRESRVAASRGDLLQALAGQIAGDRDRRRFLRECGVEVSGGTSLLRSDSQPVAEQVAAAVVDPELLGAVTRQLTDRIGPVARVLVKREAAGGGDLEAIAGRLAEQIPDVGARRDFLAAVARLG
jgi:serine/threonine-protein kinase